MRNRKKTDLTGIAPLTSYFTGQTLCFTITGTRVLQLYNEGVPQTTIAKRIGTTKQAVYYWVRKLRKHGLIHFTNIAGGVPIPSFDVRFRYLYRKLSKPVKLPYDKEHFTKGTRHTIWRVRNCTVYCHFGDNGENSIEITAGFAGGETKDEAYFKHDQEANNLFIWLSEHYPELKQAAGPLEIRRGGELALNKLRGVAANALANSGAAIIKGDGFKVDQSRGWPELQVFFDDYAKKQDITSLMDLIAKQTLAINDLATNLKDLIEISRKPPERPGLGDHR